MKARCPAAAIPICGYGTAPPRRSRAKATTATCRTYFRRRWMAGLFAGPRRGPGRPANYDPAKDPEAVASHEVKMRPAGRAWDRGGNNAFTSAMHKTESIDYGIVIEGERVMILDDREIMLNQGDIVIQVGAWHQWRHPNITCLMAFDMFPAKFVD